MNATATNNPVLEHFLATFRVQIADMEDRIDAERENLSDFRKNEATDLALTDEEKDRLPALRVLAAAPNLLKALNRMFIESGQIGGCSREAVEQAADAIAMAEGH